MIQATGIKKTYILKKKVGFMKREKQVLEAVAGLDLTIEKGEIVGLLGLNGAGKTTTIKMLSTLLSPTSGTITVDGHDIEKDAIQIKSRVNMIAGGERMLYWRLTARENLRYFGKLYGLSGVELETRITKLLEQVGLTAAANTPVERYSKGMKQRLQIARGMINNPTYLFLDEPTLGLDVPVAKQLRELVKQLVKTEKKGVLLTSHYLEEVEELCDRVYIIDKGKLVLHDTPTNIVTNIVKEHFLDVDVETFPKEKLIRLTNVFLQLGALVTCLENDNGYTLNIRAPFDPTTKILSFCMNENVHIFRLELKRPKLEDAILALAKEKSA
ncbi:MULTISPECIES: ABC transporter ATP-binding protein [Bacillus]|uniref:ABC transporter ATP-binding protein n=1 Tax=Bacillus TaxID=1386 RepID=UPI0003181E89|nr:MULTISPECIES: ABC transporter ATP-binding protein [Bacillus]